MFPLFDINKTYLISKPLGDVFAKMDTIISSPYQNPEYSIYGQFISVDPPSFVFTTKMELFRPWFQNIFSTKLIAKLVDDNVETKIIVSVTSNPSFWIAIVILLLCIVISIFRISNWNDSKVLLGYVLGIIIILIIDKLAKKILLASFERHIR